MPDYPPPTTTVDTGFELPPMIEAETSVAQAMAWSTASTAEPLLMTIATTKTDQSLRLTDRLRVLPERRLVSRGTMGPENRPIVVKWFFGRDAQRYAERERNGAAVMRQAMVPTPELLVSWRFDIHAAALVFTDLTNARELDDDLLARNPQLWLSLLQLLAQLNLAGVVHNDLHFSNVLHQPEPVQGHSSGSGVPAPTQSPPQPLWLIDGDAVEQFSQAPLPRQASVQAFATLVAQACQSMGGDELLAHWASYCRARNWPAEQPGRSELQGIYNHARRARVLHYQAKTRRTCSAFALRRTVLGEALVDRTWLNDTQRSPSEEHVRALLTWLDALPDLFVGANGPDSSGGVELLKAGNTATVIRAGWNGRELVVKRYNNKSWWHRVRRLMRPNRGLNSWVFAHTLRFVGIPTAGAVALLRTRFGGPTYLVMEASPGIELDAALLEADESLCHRLVALLARLGEEGLVHNDTKISNFLWDADSDQLQVIDLDAMQMPASTSAQLSGQKRDRRRLVRNFAATPELQRRFRGTLEL